MENKRNRIIILVALFLSIVSMTVGYSAFKEELVIKSNVYFSGNKWSIRFNNTRLLSLTEDVEELYEPLLTGSTIEISLLFEKINNKAVYSFDVENTGIIDAVLSVDPIVEFLPNKYKDNVDLSLTYEDGTPVLKGDILKSNAKKKMTLSIEYISSENMSNEYSTEVIMKIILLYSQL